MSFSPGPEPVIGEPRAILGVRTNLLGQNTATWDVTDDGSRFAFVWSADQDASRRIEVITSWFAQPRTP